MDCKTSVLESSKFLGIGLVHKWELHLKQHLQNDRHRHEIACSDNIRTMKTDWYNLVVDARPVYYDWMAGLKEKGGEEEVKSLDTDSDGWKHFWFFFTRARKAAKLDAENTNNRQFRRVPQTARSEAENTNHHQGDNRNLTAKPCDDGLVISEPHQDYSRTIIILHAKGLNRVLRFVANSQTTLAQESARSFTALKSAVSDWEHTGWDQCRFWHDGAVINSEDDWTRALERNDTGDESHHSVFNVWLSDDGKSPSVVQVYPITHSKSATPPQSNHKRKSSSYHVVPTGSKRYKSSLDSSSIESQPRQHASTPSTVPVHAATHVSSPHTSPSPPGQTGEERPGKRQQAQSHSGPGPTLLVSQHNPRNVCAYTPPYDSDRPTNVEQADPRTNPRTSPSREKEPRSSTTTVLTASANAPLLMSPAHTYSSPPGPPTNEHFWAQQHPMSQSEPDYASLTSPHKMATRHTPPYDMDRPTNVEPAGARTSLRTSPYSENAPRVYPSLGKLDAALAPLRTSPTRVVTSLPRVTTNETPSTHEQSKSHLAFSHVLPIPLYHTNDIHAHVLDRPMSTEQATSRPLEDPNVIAPTTRYDPITTYHHPVAGKFRPSGQTSTSHQPSYPHILPQPLGPSSHRLHFHQTPRVLYPS